jgi:hypothetical protein
MNRNESSTREKSDVRTTTLAEGERSRSFPKVAATMNRAHDCLWNSFNVGAANKNLMSVKSCPTKNGKGRELVERMGTPK